MRSKQSLPLFTLALLLAPPSLSDCWLMVSGLGPCTSARSDLSIQWVEEGPHQLVSCHAFISVTQGCQIIEVEDGSILG